ncbi:YncE family protein [Mycobacterium servetii]|uniref:YncE family protein n=1 Tax=Mycobacterium servetii TaxID=3237418 RepID=A0ABV4BX80_9MYCO
MKDGNDRTIARNGQVIELGEEPGSPIVVKIGVNNGPIGGIAATPDGSRLLVTNYGDDSVSVVDAATCRVTGTFAGMGEASAIAAAGPDAGRAYVRTATTAYDAIAIIDLATHTVVASHRLAHSVSDLVVSPDGARVYAGRTGAGVADVAVLDTTTGAVETVDLTAAVHTVGAADAWAPTVDRLRLSPDGVHLYVAAGGRLVVVETGARSGDGARTVDTLDIGLPIRDVALSPDGTLAYVLSSAPELGAVIDVVDTRTRRITGTRKLGEITGVVTGLTLSGDGDRAYLVSDEGITVLCTLTQDVLGSVGVADQPSCVVESPDGTYLYIAEYSGAITVAPVASIVAPGIECPGRASGSAEWVVPELVEDAPALV